MESKPEEIEKEKYQQFRKDIKDESAFTEKLNNLYYTEFEEIFQDLLLFPEEEIISSLTTGVRMILSDSYTEDIFQNKTLTSLLDKAKNKIKLVKHQITSRFSFLILESTVLILMTMLIIPVVKIHLNFLKYMSKENFNMLSVLNVRSVSSLK